MQIIDTMKMEGPAPRISPESIKASYRRMLDRKIAEEEGKRGAYEDLFAENWQRRNPGGSLEQGRAAYRGRPGSRFNPVKATDSNSPEMKFGKKTF